VTQTLGLRILHIDDVEINLLVLDQMLTMLGHSPVGAASGEAAFELMETSSFDLVLTDFHMPDVTGLDFLKNVKALREPARSTPVVVVTADVMSFTNAALREMGFAGALAKPITADAIRKVIAAIADGADQFVGDGFARAMSGR
jgi:CheY-like chemotaxis protein